MKAAAIAVSALCGILQLAGMDTVSAKEPMQATFYIPKSTDGEAIARPAGCGFDGKNEDSFVRDLGQGVAIKVIPTHTERRVGINVLFQYTEKDGLKLSPMKFELHSLPDGKPLALGRIYRSEVRKNEFERFIEEVYLEYWTREAVDRISIVIPEGSVEGHSGVLKVTPIDFEVSNTPAKVAFTPCSYASDPPAGIDPKKLKQVAKATTATGPQVSGEVEKPSAGARQVKALDARVLKGSWVVDTEATEKNLKAAAGTLSPEQFGWMAGTSMMTFGLVYEFEGDALMVRLYDSNTGQLYRLAPGQKKSDVVVYKSSKPSADDTLTATIVDGGRLRLLSQNPAMNYVEFKRVLLDPGSARKDKAAALQRAMDIFSRLQVVQQ